MSYFPSVKTNQIPENSLVSQPKKAMKSISEEDDCLVISFIESSNIDSSFLEKLINANLKDSDIKGLRLENANLSDCNVSTLVKIIKQHQISVFILDRSTLSAQGMLYLFADAIVTRYFKVLGFCNLEKCLLNNILNILPIDLSLYELFIANTIIENIIILKLSRHIVNNLNLEILTLRNCKLSNVDIDITLAALSAQQKLIEEKKNLENCTLCGVLDLDLSGSKLSTKQALDLLKNFSTLENVYLNRTRVNVFTFLKKAMNLLEKKPNGYKIEMKGISLKMDDFEQFYIQLATLQDFNNLPEKVQTCDSPAGDIYINAFPRNIEFHKVENFLLYMYTQGINIIPNGQISGKELAEQYHFIKKWFPEILIF